MFWRGQNRIAHISQKTIHDENHVIYPYHGPLSQMAWRSSKHRTQTLFHRDVGSLSKGPLNPEGKANSEKCAAFELDNSTIHPDLQTIIDHWPALPDAFKARIVAMVRSSGE